MPTSRPTSTEVPQKLTAWPSGTALLPAALAALCLLANLPLYAQGRNWLTDVLRDTFQITRPDQIEVDIDEVHQGCPNRDCIPSIDEPGFAGPDDAPDVADEDLVLGLDHAGVQRAYPAFILNHHEIVNDVLAGEPIAVTFCPLCGSGVAFRRVVGGETVEFGVSGLLHNSDLILYDRASNSLWQQITGVAIAGPHRGEALSAVPLTMTTWAEWRRAHPDTEVLIADGGRRLAVGSKRPYGDYDSSKRLMFPANSGAARILHPKQVVHGVRMPEGAVAVSERRLAAETRLTVSLGDLDLNWRREADGSVHVVRSDTGERVLAHRMFWFAWYSFNTDTALLDTEREVMPR